jgi:prepilin peptidase CpaA
MADRIAFVLLTVVLVIAAVTDWRRGKVYNWVTYPAIVAGLALWMISGGWTGGWDGALKAGGQAGLVMLVAAIPTALMFSLGALGGGDVKLMAAIGAIGASFDLVLTTIVIAIIVGFVMAVFLMFRHRVARRTMQRLWGAVLGAFARVKPEFPPDSPVVPWGVALKVGGVIAGVEHLLHVRMPWSQW